MATFQISARREDRRIDMVLRGIWTPGVARDFTSALDANVTLMRAGTDRPARSLIDVRDLSLLSVVLTPFFCGFVQKQSLICDRVAVLVQQMLGRIQARRLIAGDSRFRVFTDRAEANAWLRDGLAKP